MKRSFLALICISTGILHAQSIALPQGKKFKVVNEIKSDMTMTVMGQDMQIENNGTNYFDYVVKAISASGYTLEVTMTRMKMSVGTMGQSQEMDTDDETLRSNPQFADAVKLLNKANEIVIENKVATVKGGIGEMLTTSGMNSVGQDQSKFILTGDLLKLQQGSHWVDSSVSEQNRMVNEYTIVKTDAEGLDLRVKTSAKVNATITQGGMTIKQDVQGTINSLRHYERATGLLVKEEAETDMSGTMEVMGQTAPISLKGKHVTTVTK
jgi:hypothetical protein